jgi:hypothetical protein
MITITTFIAAPATPIERDPGDLVGLDLDLALDIVHRDIAADSKPDDKTANIKFPKGRELRELKKRVGICINGRFHRQPGKNAVVHGAPVSKGGKCQHCIDVHRVSRDGNRGQS